MAKNKKVEEETQSSDEKSAAEGKKAVEDRNKVEKRRAEEKLTAEKKAAEEKTATEERRAMEEKKAAEEKIATGKNQTTETKATEEVKMAEKKAAENKSQEAKNTDVDKTVTEERVKLDLKSLYLVLKPIFGPKNRHLRMRTHIMDAIEQRKDDEAVAKLLREHDNTALFLATRELLRKGVFTSRCAASELFPDLPPESVMPVKTLEPGKQEAAPANSSSPGTTNDTPVVRAKKAPEISSSRFRELPATVLGGRAKSETTLPSVNHAAAAAPAWMAPSNAESSRASTQHPMPIPALFPVYISFAAQHDLLGHVQSLLELACFKFGKREEPKLLEARGWDSPQSAELHRWMEMMSQRRTLLDSEKMMLRSTDRLFKSICDLRHTAVHRIRINASQIQQFLEDAHLMARMVDDAECATQIARLRQQTQETIEYLERGKRSLNSELEKRLEAIVEQRAELRRLEERAVSETLQKNEDFQMQANKTIEAAMMRLRSPFRPPVPATTAKPANAASQVASQLARAPSSYTPRNWIQAKMMGFARVLRGRAAVRR